MGTELPTGVTQTAGRGPGWLRVANALGELVDHTDIEGIWLYASVRREDREWAVAVISVGTGDGRSRIFTASYALVTRGRKRGGARVTVEEVGETPTTVLQDVLKGVQERAGETEPPVAISADAWYPADRDESTAEG